MPQFGLVDAKGTMLTAEGAAKGFMAITPHDLIPAIAGNTLGFLIEEKDAAVHVVGNDALFQIVQYRFQVILMAH